MLEGRYFTHQRVFCISVEWLCKDSSCPRVSWFKVGLPAPLNVLVRQAICSVASLNFALPLVTGLGLVAPGLHKGRPQVPEILLDAALPGQGLPAGQQRPRAPPAGAGPGTAAAGRAGVPRVPGAEARLVLLAAAVQAAVGAPGQRAAVLAPSVVRGKLLQAWHPVRARVPRAVLLLLTAGPGRSRASSYSGVLFIGHT